MTAAAAAVLERTQHRWAWPQARRFAVHGLLGSLCGSVGQLSPRQVRWLPMPWSFGQLVVLLGVWLLPVVGVCCYEAAREQRPVGPALAGVTELLAATQAYTAMYIFLVATGQAGPHLESLQLVGTGAANIGYFVGFTGSVVRDLLWWRGAMGLASGALLGTLCGAVYRRRAGSTPADAAPLPRT